MFCSPSQPHGWPERRFEMPEMATCGGQCGPKDGRKRMQLATSDALQDDRINAWSNDMGDHAECSSTMHLLTCGGTARAPATYLADMQGTGAIMLDSREGPLLMEEDGEDQVVRMDPGEVDMPEAARVGKTARRAQNKAGKSLQMPSELGSRWKPQAVAK